MPDKTCRACGRKLRIVVCIEDPLLIKQSLTRLDDKDASRGVAPVPRSPPSQAPPPAGLFD